MDAALYREMYELEDKHWWFRGRRAIILDTFTQFQNSSRGTLLDVGLGTGRNAREFIAFGFTVEGLESSSEAIAFTRTALPDLPIVQDSFPSPSVPKEKYSTLTMLDVLEHIDDDVAALQAAYIALSPGGTLLITVPAFRFLWTPHDELAHHKRRYRRSELLNKIKQAGFELQFISYFNFFLFPPIVIIRLLSLVFRRKSTESDFSRTPVFLNTFFARVFGFERFLLRHISLPFGVSLIAVAKKP
jgi:SAM-dependent methyltransferase